MACKDGQPIAGIAFREFQERHFTEIVFLVVSHDEQLQGHGAFMMNHLKQYAISIGMTHFLTYADEKALGYFRKQGFKRYYGLMIIIDS
jgi:histone acetyltransferase